MGATEGKWKPFKPFYINGSAYGGLVGSRNDLVAYAKALLKHPSPLLNDTMIEKMFNGFNIGNVSTGMSYAWFTGKLNSQVYCAHAGGGGGFYVELRVYPTLGVGSVMMLNRSGMTDQRLLDKMDKHFVSTSSQRRVVNAEANHH
jgi:D-alanyl-D-alanine carboxypeptidase